MDLALAINGACGRMGLTVGRVAAEAEGVRIAAALEAAGHPQIGSPYPPAPGVMVSDRLVKAGALIDFSTPEAAVRRLAECIELGVPAVVCTTGFTPAQVGEIDRAADSIAVVYSSNMSVGVNLLFRILPEIAAALGPEYDVDIVETHHRGKKDAPSGTAKTMLERLGGRAKAHSLRSGDEVGEHRVVFGGPGERIEVSHRATTREVFARGALSAARFAAGAEAGLYTMLDVIGAR